MIGDARSACAAKQAVRIFKLPLAAPDLHISSNSRSCARSSRTVLKDSKNKTQTLEIEITTATMPNIFDVLFQVNFMFLGSVSKPLDKDESLAVRFIWLH